MNEFFIDTNIIIRFLTNDDPVQSPLAYNLFEKAVNGEIILVLTPIIIAECTWVLSMKRYGYTKEEIADKFTQVISAYGIKTIDRDLILEALSNFSIHHVDFIDAYLAATARYSEQKNIVTWNLKDFRRLKSEFFSPEQILRF